MVHDLREELSKPVHDLREEDITLPTVPFPNCVLTRSGVIKPWLHTPEVAVAPTRINALGCTDERGFQIFPNIGFEDPLIQLMRWLKFLAKHRMCPEGFHLFKALKFGALTTLRSWG
jgi:hypothetical protein